MITLFNRKELTVTHSMETQSRVRDILAAGRVDYRVKVRNLNGSRGRGGAFMNLQLAYEYKIYVRKADYERALMLLRKD